MLQKIWDVCGRSATMAVQYAGLAFGIVVANLDNIAAVIGDPGFVTWAQSWLGANPKAWGIVMMIFSSVTMAARLRTLIKPKV